MIGYIRVNIGLVRTAKDRSSTFHLSCFVLSVDYRVWWDKCAYCCVRYRVLCRWISGVMHDAMSGIYAAFEDLAKPSRSNVFAIPDSLSS
jgi:hypothetical protein